MIGWHYRPGGHEFEQASVVGDGQGGLACCSPWGHWESETTERLTVILHFHALEKEMVSSCLENPRDGGAWWAAVYGVAQSRIQLKRLSSSSSSMMRYV